MNRTSTAVWHGTGKEGTGVVSTQSGAIKDLPYSWKTRFGDASGMSGTNPEELIAAAHAGCFNMASAFQFTGAGFTPEELKTEAVLTMEQSGTAWSIKKILLKMHAKIPNITEEKFQELACNAKEGCPVSRMMKGTVEVTL
ncbi:MAG: OsmC family protein, partial [Gemmatimonadota bacterium]|nr:OsmC family protein [Gemmatimonadota bacterium]